MVKSSAIPAQHGWRRLNKATIRKYTTTAIDPGEGPVPLVDWVSEYVNHATPNQIASSTSSAIVYGFGSRLQSYGAQFGHVEDATWAYLAYGE